MTLKPLAFFLIFMMPALSCFSFNGDRESEKGASGKRVHTSAALPSIFIMDRGEQAPANLVAFMCRNNSYLDSVFVVKLVKTYIIECRREGVNYDIAFCQMCLETGFLRFTGSVSRFQNNFCGLGATNAYTAGDWFGTMEEGVRAHIQHLKAYASIDPITPPYADKRLVHVRRGTVFTIHDLTGRWAADPAYGEKINSLLNQLYLF
jgi:hypothetical protein